MGVATGAAGEVKVWDSTYSAEIRVTRSRTTQKANGNGYFDDPPQTSSGELAMIKVTSTTLQGLVFKIHQHADLVTDE
jgi:hypothetical protein